MAYNVDSETVVYESDHPTPEEMNVFLGKIEDKIAEGFRLSQKQGVPFVNNATALEV